MHDSSAQDAAHPLISAIIPTFRRPELLLQRGLASVLAQRYPNLEVLVVMDGPDPETAAALAAIDDPRLRPLTLPENRGPADARNYAVQHARGEWVAFLDDDDIWRPDKLARQLDLALHSAFPLPVVLSGYIGRTPQGDRLHPPRPMDAGERLGDYMMIRRSASQPECPVFGILAFLSRDLALRVPWPQGLRNNEDWEWLLSLEEVEGVGFEQLSPQESSTLAVYYFGEARPTASTTSRWQPALAWAQRNREAGRLSERAFAGNLLFQVVPLAAQEGAYGSVPVLARALLSTQPTPYELLRFARQWLIPASLRRRLRQWLSTRQPPVRLEDTAPDAIPDPQMLDAPAPPSSAPPAPATQARPAATQGRLPAVKITFLIDSMTARAGMERVTARVASGLAELGLDVQILTLRGQTSAFTLPEGVQLASLNLPEGPLRMRAQTGPLARELRRELRQRQPDVLICVDTFLAGFAFPAVLDLPLVRVAWEHFNFQTDLNMRSRRLARMIAARLGHRVITLTEQDRAWWRAAFPRARAAITAIANPLPIARPGVNPYSPRSRAVLGMGRLDGQKGFDRLLRAWATLEADFPDWTLQIYGQGADEQSLRGLAAELGLGQGGAPGRWELHPPTADVTAVYRAAGVYALSSRHEGLPLVLMESQAYGVPAVAFDCPTGPAELLESGGGLLIEDGDVPAFALALRSLLAQPELRQELSERAYAGAERYGLAATLEQWLRVLAAGRGRGSRME